jgi:Xaa-Pro aminopeptidase
VEASLAMHHERAFSMHATGHWLGMDVHDVGDYRVDGHSRLLEPGMVLTVEPGLYVDPAREAVTFGLQSTTRSRFGNAVIGWAWRSPAS